MKKEIVEKFVELVCGEDTNHNLLETVAYSCIELVSDEVMADVRGHYIEMCYIEQVDEVVKYIRHLKKSNDFEFQSDDNIEFLTPLLKPYPYDLKEICRSMLNRILELISGDEYLDEDNNIKAKDYVLSYLENIMKRYDKIVAILKLPNKDL